MHKSRMSASCLGCKSRIIRSHNTPLSNSINGWSLGLHLAQTREGHESITAAQDAVSTSWLGMENGWCSVWKRLKSAKIFMARAQDVYIDSVSCILMFRCGNGQYVFLGKSTKCLHRQCLYLCFRTTISHWNIRPSLHLVFRVKMFHQLPSPSQQAYRHTIISHLLQIHTRQQLM